jgi:hypothetical protein
MAFEVMEAASFNVTAFRKAVNLENASVAVQYNVTVSYSMGAPVSASAEHVASHAKDAFGRMMNMSESDTIQVIVVNISNRRLLDSVDATSMTIGLQAIVETTSATVADEVRVLAADVDAVQKALSQGSGIANDLTLVLSTPPSLIAKATAAYELPTDYDDTIEKIKTQFQRLDLDEVVRAVGAQSVSSTEISLTSPRSEEPFSNLTTTNESAIPEAAEVVTTTEPEHSGSSASVVLIALGGIVGLGIPVCCVIWRLGRGRQNSDTDGGIVQRPIPKFVGPVPSSTESSWQSQTSSISGSWMDLDDLCSTSPTLRDLDDVESHLGIVGNVEGTSKRFDKIEIESVASFEGSI